MCESIDHGGGKDFISKDFFPSVKGEIGGDDGRFSTRPKGKMSEEDFGRLFVKGDISKFITNDQIKVFKAVLEESESFFRSCLVDLSDEFWDGGKEDGVVVLSGFDPQSDGQMCFSGTGISGEDDILSFFDEVKALELLEFVLPILGEFFENDVL